MSITRARQGRMVNEEAEMARSRARFHAERRVVTKPGDDPYRGEYDCSDCCSMTHCETHHKTEGTCPFDCDDASLDRSTSTEIVNSTDVLKAPYPDGRMP